MIWSLFLLPIGWELILAGKTDIVTGGKHKNGGLENFQLRPIVLLDVKHQLSSIKSIV
jgi:hypothetical protein